MFSYFRKPNFVFFGTPEFAVTLIEKMIEAKMPPALVVCNPDRPVGRKKIVTPPPAKIIAEKNKIPVWQPESLKVENWKLEIDKLDGLDLCVVAAYNKIIPKDILDTLPNKFIGVHPSLLPKYRGASPIQSVILAGEKQTDVTLYVMDEKVDHGPILAQEILPENIEKMNYEDLLKKLAALGGQMLAELLPKFEKGEIKAQTQDESQATFTKKFTTEDAYVDLTKDEPALIERKIRALNPEPGVWTIWQDGKPFDTAQGKRMKILEAELAEGKLILKRIQWEGKTPQILP